MSFFDESARVDDFQSLIVTEISQQIELWACFGKANETAKDILRKAEESHRTSTKIKKEWLELGSLKSKFPELYLIYGYYLVHFRENRDGRKLYDQYS